LRSLDTFTALRYLQPLREGGSLPAVVDTEGGLFVVKFRGAGQGAKALIAELIVGLLASALDLPAPELALIDVPEPFGRSEPDPEIRELLRASHGTNIGLRFLDGAFNFAPSAAGELIGASLASRIVWLDAYTTNPDRTHRNPNLLVWQRRPWLIDHGAALYAHHDWASVDDSRTRAPFTMINDHVLLGLADDLEAADAELAPRITEPLLAAILDAVPDDLLVAATGKPDFATAGEARRRYIAYLLARLRAPRAFLAEALSARATLLASPPLRLPARR
jgi:HipA-like protein